MPNRIVALVECSSSLESVCDYAAWIASGSGLPIEVLHVHEDARLRARQALGLALTLGGSGALVAELEELVAPRDRLASTDVVEIHRPPAV